MAERDTYHPCLWCGRVPPCPWWHHKDPEGPLAESALDNDPALLGLWAEAEAKKHAEDGWHFVTCPTCSGSGKVADDLRAALGPHDEALDTEDDELGRWDSPNA